MARIFVLLLIVAVGLLQMKYWVGSGGVQDVDALRERVEAQRKENAVLEQRNAALQAEVEELREGQDALEERARVELGLIKPGETFYRIVEPPMTGLGVPER